MPLRVGSACSVQDWTRNAARPDRVDIQKYGVRSTRNRLDFRQLLRGLWARSMGNGRTFDGGQGIRAGCLLYPCDVIDDVVCSVVARQAVTISAPELAHV